MIGSVDRCCLVVPVKRLRAAKTRLGLGPAERGELALASAADTVTAALRCPVVVGLVVVTDEPEAVDQLSALGADVVGDEPDSGLNPALTHGARRAATIHPGTAVGALSADLPALRPGELERALRAALRHPLALVADATGTGTTLLVARDPAAFDPAFGPASRTAHRRAGAHEVVLAGLQSLRRDVDTAEDLRAALDLGVGPRTAAVLRRLPALQPPGLPRS